MPCHNNKLLLGQLTTHKGNMELALYQLYMDTIIKTLTVFVILPLGACTLLTAMYKLFKNGR